MVLDIVQVVKVVSLEPMRVELHSQTLEVVEEMVVSPHLDLQDKELVQVQDTVEITPVVAEEAVVKSVPLVALVSSLLHIPNK